LESCYSIWFAAGYVCEKAFSTASLGLTSRMSNSQSTALGELRSKP
jgi:hypothetical protein